MLTAMGEETDRIIGLELGADDYLPKPFNPRELLARIRAVLRRAGEPIGQARRQRPRSLRFSGWTLEPARRRLLNPDGVEVPLTGGEFDLLTALVDRANRVLTRDMLLDLLRGRQAGPFDRAIDVAISRLRRKLEDDGRHAQLIKTVRGGGYVLAATVDRTRPFRCDIVRSKAAAAQPGALAAHLAARTATVLLVGLVAVQSAGLLIHAIDRHRAAAPGAGP